MAEEKVTSPRKDALVNAAKVRAIITSRLLMSDSVFVPEDLVESAKEFGYDSVKISALMERMAMSGLIKRLPITHTKYKYGYAHKEAQIPGEKVPPEETETTSFAKKAYTKKDKGNELPLDIRINEKEQTLTIRAMGLRITIGKE